MKTYNKQLPFEFVDLGLSVKWASCNLGATKPEEYGDYYMCGSVTPNNDTVCDLAHTPFNNEHKSDWFDGDVLTPEYDAAYQATGGKAHIPTKAEWDELMVNTTNEWTTENGVYGRKFTSKIDSSKYIFIPVSGYRCDSSFSNQGYYGYVWSSSLYSVSTDYAWCLYFGPYYCYIGMNYRFGGFTVRPVSS